jgi:PAS domain S-box-containing protein
MNACAIEFVLDVVPFMVWQCNEGGTVIYANHGWINYTGLSLPLKSEWHSAVHPEDTGMAVEAWKKCFTSKEVSSISYRIRNATNGGYKWHQVTHHYDTQHNCAWWVGVGTEIPLSNNVNIPVREVEEMYWRAVEAAAYPIITVDAEGVVFTFNQAAQEMFMYTPMEILGKPFAEIIDIYGAIADATSTTVQVSAKKRDGTYIPVSLSVGQFQQFGRQLYVLVLHEAEGELKMQQELHKSKDNFLRNMSHELRTPLFGLLGTMSIMQVPEDPNLQTELKRMEECTWYDFSTSHFIITIHNNTVNPSHLFFYFPFLVF